MKTPVHLNIPLARFHNVLSWDDATIGRLVGNAVEVAVRMGLRLDDDEQGLYLKEAEDKGAQVDRDGRIVRFSEADVQATIEVMRKTRPVPDPPREPVVCAEGRGERYFVGNGANLLFDWEAWQARAPASEDLVEICHWAQGCDDVASVHAPVMLKDVDPMIEPLFSYAVMGKYCRKPFYHNQPTEPIHVRLLERMARVVEQRRGYRQPMQHYEFVNPPFRMGFRAIATMLARVDLGACDTMGIGPMSVAGMSAPVTVAGTAVTALAEILAALTFFRMLRPGFGLEAVAGVGSLDLRTGRVSYFGMHGHLCNLAAWELLGHGLGVDAGCLTWYRDANEPGLQALYEFGMSQALFSSVLERCQPEIGGLANGNIFSPEQAALDMAAVREFDELAQGFDADPGTVGLESILDGGFDNTHHMTSEHTLAHMTDGVPFGDGFFRGLAGGARHDRHHTQTDELMEQAAASVRTAVAAGRETEPDEELGNELYALVEEAAAELHITPPQPA